MRKVSIFAAMAVVILSLAFTSCSKTELIKPMSKNGIKDTTKLPMDCDIVYGISKGNGKLKALGDTITGVVNEGTIINLTSTGNVVLHTEPAINCDWYILAPATEVTTKLSATQVVFNLAKAQTTYNFLVRQTGTNKEVSFSIKIDTTSAPVVPPVIPPATINGKFLRLMDVTKQTNGQWLATWRCSRQATTSTTYGFVGSMKPTNKWTGSTDGAGPMNIISTDSVDFSFYLPGTGAQQRETFMLTTATGQWLHANSATCPFWDQTFSTSGSGADDIFSFFFNPVNGAVYDASNNLVIPAVAATYQIPGALGDLSSGTVNPIAMSLGDLVIYIKAPVGSVVIFQSSTTASTAPTANWTHYLVTTAVTGNPLFSQATIPASALKTYNWWLYGSGSGSNFVVDPSITSSSWYVASAGACKVIIP